MEVFELLFALVFGTVFLAVFSVVPMMTVLRVVRRPKFPEGACGACGYDLTGLGLRALCPECGADPAAIERQGRAWQGFTIEHRPRGVEVFLGVLLGAALTPLASVIGLLCAYVPTLGGSVGFLYANVDATLWSPGGLLVGVSVCGCPTALISRIVGSPGLVVRRALLLLHVLVPTVVGVAVYSAAKSSTGPWGWQHSFGQFGYVLWPVTALLLLLLGPERPGTCRPPDAPRGTE